MKIKFYKIKNFKNLKKLKSFVIQKRMKFV